jgi:hypothetical protein
MIAADATAKKLYKTNKNKERMERFFSENMEIITGVGLQMIRAKSLSLGFGNGSEAESFESILYKYIRCSLLHESEISSIVTFSPNILSCKDGKFIFPTTLPIGICIAVISCSANRTLWMRNAKPIAYYGKIINLNTLWGKEEQIRKIFSLPLMTSSGQPLSNTAETHE